MVNRLADNLRKLRYKANLSQTELCRTFWRVSTFEVNQKQYASYEERRCEPNITTLKNIADFYEITIDELCFKKLKL